MYIDNYLWEQTSKTFRALGMVNISVLRSTVLNLASVAPVLATLVHFMAISDTISFQM